MASADANNSHISQAEPVKVLMVCLGNICRSPTAHAVFEQLVFDAGLQNAIVVDSAGTGAYHIGEPPDARSAATAQRKNYDMSAQRARQVEARDFAEFDYLLAMDYQNLTALQNRCPDIYDHKPRTFLEFADAAKAADDRLRKLIVAGEVPDPYYSGNDGFELVLELVELAAEGLLRHICASDLQPSDKANA